MPLPERPAFCASLLLEVQQLRVRTGRPHWLVFDEAHHLFPAGWAGASQTIPQTLATALAITVSPQQLDGAFLRQVNLMLAMGPSAGKAVRELAKATDRTVPNVDDMLGQTQLQPGEAVLWRLTEPAPEGVIRLEPGTKHRLRHRRKYAEGLLIPERSFYFRGPESALNLRAHNLVLFVEIAEGSTPLRGSITARRATIRGGSKRKSATRISRRRRGRSSRTLRSMQPGASRESRLRCRNAIRSQRIRRCRPC